MWSKIQISLFVLSLGDLTSHPTYFRRTYIYCFSVLSGLFLSWLWFPFNPSMQWGYSIKRLWFTCRQNLKYSPLGHQGKVLRSQTWNLLVILFDLKYREENSVLDLELVFGLRKIHKLSNLSLESSSHTKADQWLPGEGCAAKGSMPLPQLVKLYALTGCSLLYISDTPYSGY